MEYPLSLFFWDGHILLYTALILAPGPIDIEAQKITDIQSSPKNSQFVIYENPTYGFSINFPKLWEFEVAENGSANPIQVVYFYSSPSGLLL